ncbi:hypothetical protein ACFYZ6_33905 [Streptomyces rubiginosohelvolus]|uniref:hypothetical protein n=1 Tax=Streptomyces rubiginosohelvolus TaxID=67362 RepID=UPI00369E7B4E
MIRELLSIVPRRYHPFVVPGERRSAGMMPDMDAQRILSKADEIETARQAARLEAIGPLASILAERKQLEAALAETEGPYRRAYAKAGAAGWSDTELHQLGATAPEPTRRRSTRSTARSTASGASAQAGSPATS